MHIQVSPRGDHVLVKVQDKETQTTSGILLPESAQKRPTAGQVLLLGDGTTGLDKEVTFEVKEGEEVLFSKWGFAFTELKLQGEEHILLREREIIGIMPKKDASADDVPELRPLYDRILVKVDEVSEVTTGGVMLPESAREKPLSGKVIRTGKGKQEDDGTITPPVVHEGDSIVYFKYAGDQMETSDGTPYVVLHESDILCKT